MIRTLMIAMLVPALGGCVAGLAASAAGMAVRSAQGPPESNVHLAPQAQQACRERASSYGIVHIIDVEQKTIDRIIVWGTVDDGKARRSFQCDFGEKITGFKLRQIR